MATDFSQFQLGNAVFPVTTTSGNSSLLDADPALAQLLSFLSYVIATYPGPRIVAEATAANVTSACEQPITSAVMCAYPYEPSPEFLENQFPFPALFVYRTAGQSEQWTVGYDHDICGISVIYALPPLDAAACERLIPMLHAVYSTIRKKISDAWDPGYTPIGGTLGQQFTDPALCRIEEVGFSQPIDRRVASVSTGFEYGKLPSAGDLMFPALIMRGFITERDEYNPTPGGPSKFAGAAITGNIKADDGTVVLATSSTASQAATQLPPTITSLDVTTGPASGGTVVNVTGTLFLSGPPTVYFGLASAPAYAASVAYTSSTSLAVTTPAVQGAGAMPITITNRDGQLVTLANAFTFV